MEAAISSPTRKDAARRNADSHFVVWEERTKLVKQQTAADSAANDAKTARLKALRLAKEEEDRQAAALAPPPAPKKKTRKI
jgi:hypothetical protein